LLVRDLEKGVLDFSLQPKSIPFLKAARTCFDAGTTELTVASIHRYRKNLAGLQMIKNAEIPSLSGGDSAVWRKN
jgi:hypothetical protein